MKAIEHSIRNESEIDGALTDLEAFQKSCSESPKRAEENRIIAREILSKFIQIGGDTHPVRLFAKKIGNRVSVDIRVNGASTDILERGTFGSHYRERISHRYFRGENRVNIAAVYASQTYLFLDLAILAIATLLGFTLRYLTPADITEHIISEFVVPFETLFINAMKLISGPVTLCCFISTLTSTNEAMSKAMNIRRVAVKMFVTSAIALLLGLLFSELCYSIFPITGDDMMLYKKESTSLLSSFGEFIRSMMPDNVLAPFTDRNPLPLVLLSALLGIAMCAPGKQHQKLLDTAETMETVVCRVLNIIYAVCPIALFCAVLDIITFAGTRVICVYLLVVGVLFVTLGVMMTIYLLMMRKAGFRPLALLRHLKEPLLENFRIGSNIDAVHYNIRVMKEKLGISHKFLRDVLTLGAKQNMDGNCICLIFITFLAIKVTQTPVGISGFFFLLLVIIFLSLGSPNVPGSVLLGTTIVFEFLGFSQEYACVCIVLEVLTGKLLAFTNTLGDLSVVVSEARACNLIHTDADIYVKKSRKSSKT